MLRLKRKRKPEPSPVALAERARDAGEWALAARHYREALARDPGNAAIWTQYGRALKEAGNLQEAEKAYRRSLELDARIADTHLQLGHLLQMRGRKDDAAKCYFRALALDPATPPAALELITLCWEPIARLDAGWHQHIPGFLNALAGVSALPMSRRALCARSSNCAATSRGLRAARAAAPRRRGREQRCPARRRSWNDAQAVWRAAAGGVMSAVPPVSVIINTDGRAAILGTTLESLRYLRYPCFEVVVVPGPTADGTRELLQGWRGEIKVG